jgi:hypothetical protein
MRAKPSSREGRLKTARELSCLCDMVSRAACPVHGSRGNSRSFLDSVFGAAGPSEDEEEEVKAAPAPERVPVVTSASHPPAEVERINKALKRAYCEIKAEDDKAEAGKKAKAEAEAKAEEEEDDDEEDDDEEEEEEDK